MTNNLRVSNTTVLFSLCPFEKGNFNFLFFLQNAYYIVSMELESKSFFATRLLWWKYSCKTKSFQKFNYERGKLLIY